MDFHTWIFALFFLIVWAACLVLRGPRVRVFWLLLASYAFYGWWNHRYLILIVYVALADYVVVTCMNGSRRRKAWLWVSIVNNVGLLSFFKYGRFLADNANDLLRALGTSFAIPVPDVCLPLGISFLIFQSMGYTIDFYRGQVEREPSFVRYATFVSLFPRLVAGPIERAGNLLPQLRKPATISKDDVADGLSLFVVGLFKKLVLADYLALYVNRVYDAPSQFQASALALATLAFGWQIYFDFSGYTDMARGVARMMGMRLMLNFNNPYLATGLRDFWRRWHISLSTWFRDYVYIPLGGNRGGELNTYRNVFLTMVICGLWHGAAWTFVIWGAIHGLGSVLTRRIEESSFYKERVPRLAKQLSVFTFVTFAWIFFRADSVADAWLIVSRLFTTGWPDPQFPLVALALIGSVWCYQFAYESAGRRLLELRVVRIGIVVAMILCLCLFAAPGDQPFIYRQF